MAVAPWIPSWDVDDSIPTSLPLITNFIKKFEPTLHDLSRNAAVLVQHQLGSMVPLLAALFRFGLRPERTYWVEIPYSSNVTVRRELIKLGVPEDNIMPSDFVFGQDLVEYQISRVQATLHRARSRAQGNSILVLDDGCFALRAAARVGIEPGDLHIVEQTARGMMAVRRDRRLLELANAAKVINVAESSPNKILEPPYIARAVRLSIASRLKRVQEARILILGYGAIGQALCAELMSVGTPNTRMYVVDPDPTAQAAAQSHYLLASDHIPTPNSAKFDLVIGCSGLKSFRGANLSCLSDSAYLASASSGQHEFSLTELAGLPSEYLTGIAKSIHEDLRFRVGRRRVTVLNGGFPVNFDGRINHIPFRYIQFTRVLMFAAAFQAVDPRGSGVESLDTRIADWVLDEHRKVIPHR